VSAATPPLTPEQLTVRRPVWEALSELYLDTDTRPGLPALARTLAVSELSADDLRTVWQDEVTPLLHSNLLSVAGVWAGFDQDWLETRIVARRTRLGDRMGDRWPPLTRLIQRWHNELDPSFQTALTLRGELLALPESHRAGQVAAWTWLARAYFWPESPVLGPAPHTSDLETLFTALEPQLRPLLTGKESAGQARASVLKLLHMDR
jgi:hypothetical protein